MNILQTTERFKSVNFKVYEISLNQAVNKNKKRKKRTEKEDKEEEKEKREEKLYITHVKSNRLSFKNINTSFYSL